VAKIRAVIIEGEMSPAELKEYVDAFWRGDSTLTRVAAQSELVPDASKAESRTKAPAVRNTEVSTHTIPVVAAPEPEPVEVVVEAPPAPAAAPDRLEQLAACKRLSNVLQLLKDEGHATIEALIAECKTIRDSVPVLQRLGEGLEDRITRTWEGMK
jgi:cell division septation protein DedD